MDVSMRNAHVFAFSPENDLSPRSVNRSQFATICSTITVTTTTWNTFLPQANLRQNSLLSTASTSASAYRTCSSSGWTNKHGQAHAAGSHGTPAQVITQLSSWWKASAADTKRSIPQICKLVEIDLIRGISHN